MVIQVNVSVSATDSFSIEVVLRCLAVEGDGLGQHELNDGGVLATVVAAGFKGSGSCWVFFVFRIYKYMHFVHCPLKMA